ncbi:Uncharacterised protein [Escherichia coli]|uniref:Uncharacterized protein n=1 Tax=Escherichia coli TaxID=562 RepID=A0A377AQ48_ECOLX|nr:Uncharacterised protein [Escherichia coli]
MARMVLYGVSDRPVELNLYSLREHIENLISLEAGIDQVVEMRITGAGVVHGLANSSL